MTWEYEEFDFTDRKGREFGGMWIQEDPDAFPGQGVFTLAAPGVNLGDAAANVMEASKPLLRTDVARINEAQTPGHVLAFYEYAVMPPKPGQVITADDIQDAEGECTCGRGFTGARETVIQQLRWHMKLALS
jgi:hypothetical protein